MFDFYLIWKILLTLLQVRISMCCNSCKTWEQRHLNHRAWGHVPPTFTNIWAWGAPWGKQETGQNVLPITKALTKTTDRTCRAKKVEGTTKNLSGACHTCPPPQFQIASGATAREMLTWAPETHCLVYEYVWFIYLPLNWQRCYWKQLNHKLLLH